MKYSLFIGRWQPFHDGHKKLIETALDRGKNVLVAIRDTEIDEKNPYTVDQRRVMIYKALAEYLSRVKVIVIPDIEEVIYGRDVGYEVKEVRLDSDTESISGTKIRQAQKDSNLQNV